MQANSAQSSIRKTAMRALSDIIEVDAKVLAARTVEETVDMRLRDESSWVRQVSLDLLGRVLEGSLGEDLADEEGQTATQAATPLVFGADAQTEQAATSRAVLLRFHRTVRGRINDTSVLVRRQASKILSAFVLSHPDHPDVVEVAHDLMRRSSDSDILRNLVLGTFELLWFMDDEPSPRAALQLARVVDASRTMGVGPSEILTELLQRFRKNIGTRKHSKGFDFALRRWTTLMLNEFVQLGADEKAETAQQRRSLLSTLEAFALAQSSAMQHHIITYAIL